VDIGSILILLLVLIAVIFVITRPFFRLLPESDQKDPDEIQVDRHLEYELVLKHLKDLEFEKQLGKISAVDFEFLRGDYQKQAVELLVLLGEPVEAENPDSSLLINSEIEHLVIDRRMQRRERSAGFCSKCGKTIQKSDRFCPKCGAKAGE
jgi:hypothetical protein